MKNLCEQAALYFYEELTAQERETFKTHLDSCAACQQELAFLKATQSALVPPAAPQAVVERVLIKSHVVPFWRRMYKWALAATLVIGLGVWGFMGRATLEQADDMDAQWLAYVSADMDEDYANFAADFEAFEKNF